MFESAQEFIDFIEKRVSSKQKIKGGFLALMDRLNHPERSLRCLHVAGTNGKGSVTDYLRSILQERGYRVGSFTSPHLTVWNDRIRINDVNIPDDKLLTLANRYSWAFDEYDLSFFEIGMLLSVFYYLEEEVDYVVYEVGMGGRLDATNIIQPIASIITNIGYDHMAILGDTLEKIAFEKAGIIKDNTPVFTAEYKQECLQVFREQAEKHHSPLFVCTPPEFTCEQDHIRFSYLGYDIVLNSLATYQVKNASLAVLCADYLEKNHLIDLTDAAIIKGIEKSFWKGRFEIMQKEDPLIIVDGAHNEHGVSAILDSVRRLKRPLCIIACILKDKQHREMLQELRKVCDELVITNFDYYRVTPIDELAEGIEATVIDDYHDAIAYAEKKYRDGCVLMTGSLYFVSEVRALYKKEEA